jgi:hypothetical protein
MDVYKAKCKILPTHSYIERQQSIQWIQPMDFDLQEWETNCFWNLSSSIGSAMCQSTHDGQKDIILANHKLLTRNLTITRSRRQNGLSTEGDGVGIHRFHCNHRSEDGGGSGTMFMQIKSHIMMQGGGGGSTSPLFAFPDGGGGNTLPHFQPLSGQRLR